MKFCLNFSSRYALFEAEKTAQSQNNASCKDGGGTLLRSLAKPVKPSDDALMRGGLRLRKFVLLGSQICLSLNLVHMRSPYAAMVRVGLRLNLLRSRCVLR